MTHAGVYRHLTKRKNKLKKTQIRKNLKIIRSVKKLTIINFQIQKIDSFDDTSRTDDLTVLPRLKGRLTAV